MTECWNIETGARKSQPKFVSYFLIYNMK